MEETKEGLYEKGIIDLNISEDQVLLLQKKTIPEVKITGIVLQKKKKYEIKIMLTRAEFFQADLQVVNGAPFAEQKIETGAINRALQGFQDGLLMRSFILFGIVFKRDGVTKRTISIIYHPNTLSGYSFYREEEVKAVLSKLN